MLPINIVSTILPFLCANTSEDDFHEMIVLCYTKNVHKNRHNQEKASSAISSFFKEKQREENTIYNPHRNISFNQCFGDSNVPLSEWLNVTPNWDEE